jgi:hypothetical protein
VVDGLGAQQNLCLLAFGFWMYAVVVTFFLGYCIVRVADPRSAVSLLGRLDTGDAGGARDGACEGWW